MRPGAADVLDLAARVLPPRARVLDLGAGALTAPRFSSHRVVTAPPDDLLGFLQAQAADPAAGAVALWPTRDAALIPLLHALHDALAPDARAVVADLVWQTAPTPELLRAFTPAAGRERVRPIEGFEMQVEHAGFDVVEKREVPRAAWTHALPDAQRAAVDADARGAARFMAWVLKPSDE